MTVVLVFEFRWRDAAEFVEEAAVVTTAAKIMTMALAAADEMTAAARTMIVVAVEATTRTLEEEPHLLLKSTRVGLVWPTDRRTEEDQMTVVARTEEGEDEVAVVGTPV